MIAVVGLGNLGLAFARRLDEVLGETVGIDPAASARDAFTAAGGRAEPDLDQVDWALVRQVFVVVRTVGQALAVVADVTSRSGTARIFVVTTLDPASAVSLADGAGAAQVIESPISGGSEGTLAGTLTVMVAGPVSADDIAFLEGSVAGQVIAFDQRGEATLAKLVNNAVMAANTLIVADALAVANDLGLSPTSFLDLLTSSSGGSRAATKFRNLDASLLEKDARLLLESTTALAAASVFAPLVEKSTSLEERIESGRLLVSDQG